MNCPRELTSSLVTMDKNFLHPERVEQVKTKKRQKQKDRASRDKRVNPVGYVSITTRISVFGEKL